MQGGGGVRSRDATASSEDTQTDQRRQREQRSHAPHANDDESKRTPDAGTASKVVIAATTRFSCRLPRRRRTNRDKDSWEQVTRIGEAKHPGPVVEMPMDGQCVLHALAYHKQLTQKQVWRDLALNAAEIWYDMCPWDDGTEIMQCLSTKMVDGERGEGRRNAAEVDPIHEDVAQQLQEDLEEYLAQLRVVPWVAGGDWNTEPQSWMQRYTTSMGRHRRRNLDRYLSSVRAPMVEPRAVVVPGTDHVGIPVTLRGAAAEMLGRRIAPPNPIEEEHIAQSKADDWRRRYSVTCQSARDRTHGFLKFART